MEEVEMTLEQIKESLDGLGVVYDKRLGADKLAPILEKAIEAKKAEVDAEQAKNKPAEGENAPVEDKTTKEEEPPKEVEKTDKKKEKVYAEAGEHEMKLRVKCDGVIYEKGAKVNLNKKEVKRFTNEGWI